jgi:hypothetical protein
MLVVIINNEDDRMKITRQKLTSYGFSHILVPALVFVLIGAVGGTLLFRAKAAACSIKGEGSPGAISFTMKLTSDTCHWPAESAAECFPDSQDVYGATIDSKGRSSKANCGLTQDDLKEWGYIYSTNGKTWNKEVVLGENGWEHFLTVNGVTTTTLSNVKSSTAAPAPTTLLPSNLSINND